MASNEEAITSVLHENRLFYPSTDFSNQARVKSLEEYKRLYAESIADPIGFWARRAEDLHWFRKWDNVLRNDNGFYKWFEGGELNLSYNCLDRHINNGQGNKVALFWESESGETRTYTYSQLLRETNKMANTLRKLGINRGDRVCIYLPMIPELTISVLACARIGAVHSVIFGGFASTAIRDRVQDSDAKLIITSDGSFRNNTVIPLKENVDKAALECPTVQHILVVKRCANKITMQKGRDVWLHELQMGISSDCPAESLHSEDNLFILYTSGTTGKPKGILHTQAGYLLYTHDTFKYVFDVKPNDVYFCTADVGWITGHSYIIYGPLSNAATVVMYEGGPMYPEADRFWRIIEKYKVTLFYTAPTAIRALMKFGEEFPNRCDLSSLRLLGSVGEPINPEAWMWYHSTIGKGKCPIVDTWWQTETGGFLLTPLPGATPLKPGSATLPYFGIVADVLKEDGTPCKANEGGNLVIKTPWPSILRTVWKNPEKYLHNYFGQYPGLYLTGDSAKFDEDGYFWVMGRNDDVMKVSGHRIGTSEVESHLVSHPNVAEAGVVPIPDVIKGQAIYAFVVLKKGVKRTEALKKDIIKHIAEEMGHIAKPEKLQFADDLPKTRSGKIMRRILKAIAEGADDLGNTTTLADPTVVEKLKAERIP